MVVNEIYCQGARALRVDTLSFIAGESEARSFVLRHLGTQRELLSGDRGAFQNGCARTRSDADAAHMRKASGIMQMPQTRQMQIDEDACIRN